MDNLVLLSIVSVKTYNKYKTQKLEILEENKNKSGIYKIIDNLNGKFYIFF